MRRLWILLMALLLLMVPTIGAAQAPATSQGVEFHYSPPEGPETRFVEVPADAAQAVMPGDNVRIETRIRDLDGILNVNRGASGLLTKQQMQIDLVLDRNRRAVVTGEVQGRIDGDPDRPFVFGLSVTGSGRCVDGACAQIRVQLELTGQLSDDRSACGQLTLRMEAVFDRVESVWILPGSLGAGSGDLSAIRSHWYVPDMDSDQSGMVLSGCGEILLSGQPPDPNGLGGRQTGWVSLDGMIYGFNFEEIRWDYYEVRIAGVTQQGQLLTGTGVVRLEVRRDGTVRTGPLQFAGTLGSGEGALAVQGSGQLNLESFLLEPGRGQAHWVGAGTYSFKVEIEGVTQGALGD